MKPIKIIFDCATQEEIVREMNDSEYAQYLIDVAAWEAKQAEQQAEAPTE